MSADIGTTIIHLLGHLQRGHGQGQAMSIFVGNAPLIRDEVLVMYADHVDCVEDFYGADSDEYAEAVKVADEVQAYQAYHNRTND
jgi:hypothetical protein